MFDQLIGVALLTFLLRLEALRQNLLVLLHDLLHAKLAWDTGRAVIVRDLLDQVFALYHSVARLQFFQVVGRLLIVHLCDLPLQKLLIRHQSLLHLLVSLLLRSDARTGFLARHGIAF